MSSFRSSISIPKRWSEDGVLQIINSFPELYNGEIGLFNITAVQLLCAFATENEIPSNLKYRLSKNNHINLQDYLGRTPLLYAVLNGNVKLVELLLTHGANIECKLTCEREKIVGEKKSSVGDVQKYKELLQMLPLFDLLGVSSQRTPLHIAVKKGHIEIVKLLVFKGADVNCIDSNGLTPLLLAGCNSLDVYEEITRILVSYGADVTKTDSTGATSLYHAVHLGSYEMTKLLLKQGAWLTNTTNGENELHVAALKGFTRILNTFLEDSRFTIDDINRVDSYGRSPSYLAAYADRKDCFKLLLNKGADMSLCTKSGETVSDKFFKNVSDPIRFLTNIFDGCVENDPNHGIKLNFAILAPKGCQQMKILHSYFNAIEEQEKLQLLHHPLLQAYLNLKWSQAKPFFYFLIISYIVFVLSLSIYILMLVKKVPYVFIVSVVSRYILTISATGLLIHAIIQAIVMIKNLYNKFEIWMNITSTTIALTVIAFAESNDLKEIVASQEWVLHSTSVAVLLAWTELMLLIGRFPNLGYYALMFGAVLLNVIKVLSTFISLVIGFALCFSIQFYNDETFQNVWLSMVKTMVMMIGEFEYVDLFSTANNTSGLHVTSRIIFFLFIIVVSIVLMNLMVGLAVSDIQGLQQESSARRLEKQAEFLLQLETVIDRVIKWKIFPKCFIRFLIKSKSISLDFTVKTEWYNYHRRKSFNLKEKLSPKLLEAIVSIARKNGRREVKLSEKQMGEIIEKIKLLLDTYEV
ncbi:transient receptor potential channel pyrexia-like [Onthophagus taurus]|uniref:transient receptor potential channel pyrexia-like n=1 Tax=Onthophagus taurus TaxID=166361 RepID=UPI0039BE25FC